MIGCESSLEANFCDASTFRATRALLNAIVIVWRLTGSRRFMPRVGLHGCTGCSRSVASLTSMV
jgi:hypothetical protein